MKKLFFLLTIFSVHFHLSAMESDEDEYGLYEDMPEIDGGEKQIETMSEYAKSSMFDDSLIAEAEEIYQDLVNEYNYGNPFESSYQIKFQQKIADLNQLKEDAQLNETKEAIDKIIADTNSLSLHPFK